MDPGRDSNNLGPEASRLPCVAEFGQARRLSLPGNARAEWSVVPTRQSFTVFGLQGLLMWIISIPIQVGVFRVDGWHAGIALGLLLWLVGIFFESLGDFQLARFKANPANRGKVMNRGLWRYTRHPNYFGDFLFGGVFTSWLSNQLRGGGRLSDL